MKREASTKRPVVWIGKAGTESKLIEEISRQLDKKGTIKIRVLDSALRNTKVKNIAAKIAETTEASLIDVRGHTFILHKPKRKKAKKLL
jgi:putative YhbY family RNA-binding protein